MAAASQLERAFELSTQMLDCRTFSEFTDSLVPLLARDVGATSYCFFETRLQRGGVSIERWRQHGWPDFAHELYSKHFIHADPLSLSFVDAAGKPRLHSRGNRTLRLSDVCPMPELLRSDYYNEFLRAVDVKSVLGLFVRPESDPTRIMAIGLSSAQFHDFDGAYERAKLIQPALSSVLEQIYLRERMEDREGSEQDACVERWAKQAALTLRESDVTRQVVAGRRNAEIADNLGLSARTVENHLRSVYGKSGVRSRAELIYQVLSPAEGPRPEVD